jgi:hypothetical protein
MKTPPQDIKNPDSSISIKKKTAITLKKWSIHEETTAKNVNRQLNLPSALILLL